MTRARTFAEVDGLDSETEAMSPSSSLDEWYARVRNVPIDEMDVGDLARACRQKLHLRLVMPVVANHLRIDPLAGDIYDGELVNSLLLIPKSYWKENPTDAADLRNIALKTANLEDDVRESFLELKGLLGE